MYQPDWLRNAYNPAKVLYQGYVLPFVTTELSILSLVVKTSTFLSLFLVCSYASVLADSIFKMATESKIAVIGMACRLPGGADNPESLWSMLAEGRDGLREVPKDRWDWKSFYHENPDAREATNFSHGYYVDQDVSAFDARFFGIPGAEATGIDPQQRLLLETTYEAIENAGIPIKSLRGSNTSVHMAMFARDYDRMGYRDGPQLHKTHIIGSGDAILSNRISYVLDLKGSSNTLDTGCVSITSPAICLLCSRNVI